MLVPTSPSGNSWPANSIGEGHFDMMFRAWGKNEERVKASVVRSPTGVVVKVGTRQFFVGSSDIANRAEIADFALYGLAAIGMSHGVTIDLDAPVTASAVDQVNRLGGMWELWATRAPRRLYPLRLSAAEVITGPSVAGSGGGVLCMSGGVDSTFAAITAPKELNFTGAMLIAGADYPSENDSRFLALKDRVYRLSRLIGLEPLTVATDIRQLKIEFRMFHTVLLAMCLHFASDRYSHGGFAADYSGAQEYHVHPWGNNRLVATTLETERFPVSLLGEATGRSAKVRAIAAHEKGLMSYISVCSGDISSSGNCGVCAKCVRTKLNLMTGGYDFATGFVDGSSPLVLLDQLPLERSSPKLFGIEAFLQDILADLRDDEARQVVRRYLERVRRAYWKRPTEKRRLSFA